MEIRKLRERIDKIDKKMLGLLNQRAKEAIKVSELKKKKKLAGFSPEREASMLRRLKSVNKGPFNSTDVENVFREILSVCRAQRANLRIAYLGPQGTFTHLAATKKFGKRAEYIPAESISACFDRVESKEADYGVVPIENSTEGVINYTLDMFFTSALNICAEVVLDISHALLCPLTGPRQTGPSLKNIKRVYSNPQVFAQCRKWLSRSLEGVELVPVSSTAKAAMEAKGDRYGVCIGNKILAGLYGLKVIASSIEDSHNNYTRFLIIAKEDSLPSGRDKTSILFSIKDKVGALYDILSSFKNWGVNLTKIESRPSKQKPWEYYFFVDIKGHKKNAGVQKALKELKKECIFVKILGSYPTEN